MTTSSSLSVTRLSSQARIAGDVGQLVPMRGDVPRRRLAEHEAFEQAVGGQAVGAVQARLGDFAGRIEARRVGAAVEVDDHAAAGVMLRRDDRDRLAGDVDAEPEQLLVDVREVRLHELGLAVADVEVDVVEAVALDLVVDRAGDDVARRKLGALVDSRA